jgi:carbon-monoxide dehydrogenase small subunit
VRIEGMDKIMISFTLNGSPVEVAVKPKATLNEVLREDLDLTGTKCACNSGACGSCTVLVDGHTVNSCSVLAVQVNGRQVGTIEGLAQGPDLHPLQEAFLDHGGFQCGFCTPGMLMSAKELLDENPDPAAEEVREGIAGNLCRCTGYVKIVDSILAAARTIREEKK